MQDAYVGDIGDFAKYGLLRALGVERRLGVAWYLHPGQPRHESGGDGRFTQYLLDPATWSALDPELFEALGVLVGSRKRSVRSIEASGLLGEAVFAGEPLDLREIAPRTRESWRRQWFRRVTSRLADCEIIFADPDNGLCLDERFRPTRRESAKGIPLAEVAELVGSRPAIIYHHNSRFRGGHAEEIRSWMGRLPNCDRAWYWRRWSNRTFFILNADSRIEERLQRFADRWKPHADLVFTAPRHQSPLETTMTNVTPLQASRERIADKLDRVEQQLEAMNKRLGGVEGRLDHTVGTMTRLVATMERGMEPLNIQADNQTRIAEVLENHEGALKDTGKALRDILAILRRL